MLRGGNPEKLFVSSLAEVIKNAHTILDIGTPQRFSKELRPYEALFSGKQYIAAGYHPSGQYGVYNCDCHQDIQAMTFEDDSFDAILCIEVLEHVANPFAAAAELHRVLRPGGMLFLTTPFLHQYHGKKAVDQSPEHDAYPDYWRFTHQGLQLLSAPFREARIIPLDGPIEFRLKQFYLTSALACAPIRKLVDTLDRPQLGKSTTRHLLVAVK